MLLPCRTKVVGVTFDNRQAVVAELKVGDRLFLAREPLNEADARAIAFLTGNGQRVGYLKQDSALHPTLSLKQYSDLAATVSVTVLALTGGTVDKPSRGVNVEICDASITPTMRQVPLWRSTSESLLQDALTAANNRIAELEQQLYASRV